MRSVSKWFSAPGLRLLVKRTHQLCLSDNSNPIVSFFFVLIFFCFVLFCFVVSQDTETDTDTDTDT